MDRDPPDAVKKLLRREVEYGCPVHGCRRAFLTWHHFDPPWNIENHHRPEGMIALCREHHDAADRGTWSKSELHEFKARQQDVGQVRANFPWFKKSFLLRIGGFYMVGTRMPIRLHGESVVEIARAEADLMSLSFRLRSADGTILATMENNSFAAQTGKLHDLSVAASASEIKIWFAERDIGLSLRFHRLTVDKVAEYLREDFVRSCGGRLEPSIGFDPQNAPSPAIQEQLRIGNIIGAKTLALAVKDCADDEARIPFINFGQLKLYWRGQRVVFCDGVSGPFTIGYGASLNSADGPEWTRNSVGFDLA